MVGSAADGGAVLNAQVSGVIGQNAVENNDVGASYTQWKKEQELLKTNPEAYKELKAEQLKVIGFLIDFIPVIGDIKGFVEAETKGDYFFSAIGLIPLYGDAALKVHQAAKVYQAAKAVKDVDKMKAAMHEARRGADLPYDSRQIRAELERRYGAENVVSTTVPKKPVQSANNQNKPNYVSVIYTNESGKAVNVKYKDPVSGNSIAVNIAYDSRGLPVFDNVSKFTTKLDTSLSYTGQMRAATRDLWKAIESGKLPQSQFTKEQLMKIKEGNEKIPEYTWHHNAQSSPNNMQLIPTSIHKAVRHTGQNSLKKGQ